LQRSGLNSCLVVDLGCGKAIPAREFTHAGRQGGALGAERPARRTTTSMSPSRRSRSWAIRSAGLLTATKPTAPRWPSGRSRRCRGRVRSRRSSEVGTVNAHAACDGSPTQANSRSDRSKLAQHQKVGVAPVVSVARVWSWRPRGCSSTQRLN
jgi:hypothetical protein